MINTRSFQLIFFNTVSKEYRNKGLLFLAVITILFLLGLNSLITHLYNNFIDQSSLGGVIGDKTMIGLFYFVNFWASFLGVLLGVNCLRSDFETGVISQILSFPIKRSEYFFARIFGTWLIVNVYFVFSLLFAVVLLSFSSKSLIFQMPMLSAFFLSNLNILAAILFGATVSLFLPKLFSFVFVILLSSLISMSNGMIHSVGMEAFVQNLNFYKIIGLALHYLFPRMGDLNSLIGSYLLEKTSSLNLMVTLGHYAITIVIFSLVVQFFFTRKEI